MANKNLGEAKAAKNDEFYTQYADIAKEIEAYIDFNPDVFRGKTVLLPCDDPEWSNFTKYFAQNFERFGLKKLISTSYAIHSKKYKTPWQPTLFETENPNYNPAKSEVCGKLFVLERGNAGIATRNDDADSDVRAPRLDIHALQWTYLEGDGDFRSDEVRAFRDEADIIVTNPPFSLFREFVEWLVQGKKKFVIIGNMNAISYKEVFPLIKENKIWMGESIHSGDRAFNVPNEYPLEAAGCGIDETGRKYIQVKGVRWFTNIDHGRRHQPMALNTMAENIKHNKKLGGKYYHYANYDAIEVPTTDAIPSDYDGTMGVPLSFLDKYCPEQFEIIGQTQGDSGKELGLVPYDRALKKLNPSLRDGQLYYLDEKGMPIKPYARILIRHKR